LDKGTFSGNVDITLNVAASCDYIAIHHKGLTIENSKLISINGSIIPIRNAFDYPKNEFWIVQLSVRITPGVYNLILDFSGSLVDDIVGFYRSSYKSVTGETRCVK
jgi:hypothetical protein